MKKVAAYARYSTESQDEKSIAYQLNAIEEYCSQNGYTIVDTYADEAMSGTNTDRPQFKRLLRDADNRKFDIVVVYDVTRGSRDVGDWFTFRKHMMYAGIEVESVHGKLGSYTDSDSFITELINVGMGQREVLANRQKSLDSKKLLAKQGKFLGGIPPFGYNVVNQQYVINREEAEVVKKIFKLYVEGKSYQQIADSIGTVYGKMGKPLNRNSFHGILEKEIYTGTYTFNKLTVSVMRKYVGRRENPNMVRVENAVPAIIDKETWEEAQKRLKDRKHRGRYKAKVHYALSGLVHCAECGSAYCGQYSKNTRGYGTRYYVCSGRKKKICKNILVNADKLEETVFMRLREWFLNNDYGVLADIVINAYNKTLPTHDEERRELAEVDKKIHNFVVAIGEGAPVSEIKDSLLRLKERQAELRELLLKAPPKVNLDRDMLIDYFRVLVENWNVADKERIVRENVMGIEIEKTGNINVMLTLPVVCSSGGLGVLLTESSTICKRICYPIKISRLA